MAVPFVQPCSHMPIPGGSVTLCGPTLKIHVGSRVVDFEMHSYFGPTPLTKRGEEMLRVPKGFWSAIEAWESTGRLMDGDFCITGKEVTNER